MKKMIPNLFLLVCLTGCTTLNDSLQLGAGLGALGGGAAAAVAYSSTGRSPSFENVAIGASIGAAAGLLTSYLVHRSVVDDRQSCQADETEMHFGDLPPSPFIVPKTPLKKGNHNE